MSDTKRDALIQLLKAMHSYKKATGTVPVVADIEVYEHFGNPCKISEVTMSRGGEHEVIQVTLVARFFDYVTIDPDALQLRAAP